MILNIVDRAKGYDAHYTIDLERLCEDGKRKGLVQCGQGYREVDVFPARELTKLFKLILSRGTPEQIYFTARYLDQYSPKYAKAFEKLRKKHGM